VFEIGNSLREARLRQHLDFPELEQATKIRSRYLRALEEEEFGTLPAETYVKGFLRAYAEYLGLDGQLYVDEYNSRYVVGEDEPVARPRRSTARRPERHVDSRVVVLTLAGIVAVVALFILAWKFGGSNNGHIANLDNSKPPAAKKHRKHRAVPVSAHLVLKAVGGGCRLEVYRNSASGKLLWAGTLEPGKQAISLWGKRMWVRAGAPRHLAATLNGRRLTFPTGRAVVVTSRGFQRVNAAA
jgi:cytoskeleton protein RodZ